MMKTWWPFLLSVLVALADRATKLVIETGVPEWRTIPVIPGLFQIVHTRNTGIAFSLFTSPGGVNPLLVLFTIAVMSFTAWMLFTASRPATREHWTLRLALAFVLGGAAGNLYDRALIGSVTDFLDFYWRHHHFPIFNLADSAITAGATLLLVNLWFVRKSAAEARS